MSRLTKPMVEMLWRLASGQRVRMQRTFPFPHQFDFIEPNTGPEKGWRGAPGQVSESAVGVAAGMGWIKPDPQNKTWDLIHYTITKKGEEVLKSAPAGFLPKPAKGAA